MQGRKRWEREREGERTLAALSLPQSLNGGINVIQLETAVGSAIKNFSGAVGQL